ncbi:DUF6507 family protein [Nocardiopsis flavescens]|uniref:Excreted virulence factor EspC, type VII ESX diderm n=1 Tax=Nocardiopsis flavescens TaxID=758803 RepID=A0A1M6LY46_9ACTN|nr:DUF6507 family protein [Nocardiopsis flavescens]SHJ76121.1 hypothetical protein SAMN05421803_109105 [Nocardiopsis flavescens]
MSQWNIQPAAVGGVLQSVAGHLGEEGSGEGLVGVMESVEEHLMDCGEYAKSGIIGMALGEFAGHYFGIMGDIAGLTMAAVTGASEATTHYMNGNLEMAEESQANAGVIPEPEPPPVYGPNQPV